MNWMSRPTTLETSGASARRTLFVARLRARLFGEADRGGAPAAWPTIDVEETDREFRVSVDIPGVENEDVHLRVADRALIVEGERRPPSSEPGRFTYRERGFGPFLRQLPLPSGADTTSVDAQLAHGTLRVTVAKTAARADAAREIEIR
jgi:HSP20 family protein